MCLERGLGFNVPPMPVAKVRRAVLDNVATND
jgi:hypothetical protein